MIEPGFSPLFNGIDLEGWVPKPRLYGTVYPGGPLLTEVVEEIPADYNERSAQHPARWSVEDGVIVGRQDEPGSGWGGALVSERTYGDFDLRLEMKPDWPADTGVMLRRKKDSWEGLQVVVDHRRSGSIGGFFGNGIGEFHAIAFTFTAVFDEHGRPVGLREEDPSESLEAWDPEKPGRLESHASCQEFLSAWRWNDWNDLRVVCVGKRPRVTTWINGVQIATIDLDSLRAPNYVASDVGRVLGRRGHLALEVHENDPFLGPERWGANAACRWRSIRIREL